MEVMSFKILIEGIVGVTSSDEGSRFNGQNETNIEPTLYYVKKDSESIFSSASDAVIQTASTLNETVVNATASIAEAVIPSQFNSFSAGPSFPGGDPGGLPVCAVGNTSASAALKKLPLHIITSPSEFGNNSSFLYGLSWGLIGTAAVVSAFFLGRAIYRGYKRYQSLIAAADASEQRDLLVQMLIQRQKQIDRQWLKKRHKITHQDRMNLQYLNKMLAKKRA